MCITCNLPTFLGVNCTYGESGGCHFSDKGKDLGMIQRYHEIASEMLDTEERTHNGESSAAITNETIHSDMYASGELSSTVVWDLEKEQLIKFHSFAVRM